VSNSHGSPFCLCEPFALCHSEGVERPKNLAQGKLREAISANLYCLCEERQRRSNLSGWEMRGNKTLPQNPTEIAAALRASQRYWLVAHRDCHGTTCLATTWKSYSTSLGTEISHSAGVSQTLLSESEKGGNAALII